MACAAAMPQLAEDHPATLMDRVGHIAPRCNLSRRVETGLERPGARPGADGDAARNDEPGARALREIARRVGIRYPAGVSRTRSLHRRHDNAVLEMDRAEIIRIE